MAPENLGVPLEPDGPGKQRSVVVLSSPKTAASLIPRRPIHPRMTGARRWSPNSQ